MTRDRMTNEMSEIFNLGGFFNWSFWEHENVHTGDICYLVRCGDAQGPHGVMLRGKIISEPYHDEDWSGRGRRTIYADWYPQEFVDTEYCPPLLPEKLEEKMPDFNWRGGHSGRELPKEYEAVLETLWYEHIRGLLPELYDGLFVNPRANELTPSTLDFWKIVNAAADAAAQ